MAKRTQYAARRSRDSRGISVAIIFSAVIISAALFFGGKAETTSANVIKSTPIVSEYDSVRLPVPAAPVATGTKLSQVKFRTVAFPKQQVPPGAIHELTPYLDAVAIAPLPANLPLFATNVSLTAGASNPVIESIPEGMRAMTIRVDATSAVEGWAGSGAVVDVLLVRRDGTSVVAEKVKILSAERSVSPVQGTESPNVPSTVTLLVSQDQCLAINTAIPMGKIAFALRSTVDEGGWHLTRFRSDNLKNATSPQARSKIQGFVQIEGESQFALSNGTWIESETIPDGFRLKKEDRKKAVVLHSEKDAQESAKTGARASLKIAKEKATK